MPPAVPETPALYIESRESFEFPALFFFPSNTSTLQIRKLRTGTMMCYCVSVLTHLPFGSSKDPVGVQMAPLEMGKLRLRQSLDQNPSSLTPT